MTTAVQSDRQPLADQVAVAEYLKVPVRTLEQWRRERKGPRWVPVGRHVRYAWPDVDAWVAEQARGGSA
jgi:excisionase family DNA binding protein